MSASGARRLAGRFAIVAVLSGLLLPIASAWSGGPADAAQAATVLVAKTKQAPSWKTVRTEEFSGY